MKTITLTMLVLLSITASGQQKQSTFNHARDKGRKTVVDTTKNEVVNGKYSLYVAPVKEVVIVKPVVSKDTVKAAQETPLKETPLKSIVIIDVQKALKSIMYKQNKAGAFLIEARKSRVQSFVWAATCSAIGSVSIALAKGKTIGTNFGIFAFALGGTVSIVKLVDSFNKIGFAGKALID
jgi:hypothetical protein